MIETPTVSRPVSMYIAVSFDWKDAFNLDSQLTEEEIIVRDQFKGYCQDKLMPRIVEGNRHEGPKSIPLTYSSLQSLNLY